MSEAGDKIMSATSYAGAIASVVSGLTLTDWGILIGIVTALLTFVANQVWQARKDRRDWEVQRSTERRAELIHQLEVDMLTRSGGSARARFDSESA